MMLACRECGREFSSLDGVHWPIGKIVRDAEALKIDYTGICKDCLMKKIEKNDASSFDDSDYIFPDIIIKSFKDCSKKASDKLPPKLQNSYDGTYIAPCPSSSSPELYSYVYNEQHHQPDSLSSDDIIAQSNVLSMHQDGSYRTTDNTSPTQTLPEAPQKISDSQHVTMKPVSEMTDDELASFFSDEEDIRIQMELEKEAKEYDELNKEQESDMEDDSFNFIAEELALALALQELQFQGQFIAQADYCDDDFDDFD